MLPWFVKPFSLLLLHHHHLFARKVGLLSLLHLLMQAFLAQHIGVGLAVEAKDGELVEVFCDELAVCAADVVSVLGVVLEHGATLLAVEAAREGMGG